MKASIEHAANAAKASDDSASLRRQSKRLLTRFARAWKLPDLAERITVVQSRRMTRSLGRCYPEQREIRVSAEAADGNEATLAEVLCHEAAHIVAYELYGTAAKPHGPEWANLVRAAGYDPKVHFDARPVEGEPPRKRRSTRMYDHVCPACHTRRRARRRVLRWRCARCVAAGLPGELVIEEARAGE